jgi:hypothetical protein
MSLIVGQLTSSAYHSLHPTAVVTRCEGNNNNNNNNILEIFFPKNNDGTTNWHKASQQITDSIFWDQFGKMTGAKVNVGCCCFVLFSLLEAFLAE